MGVCFMLPDPLHVYNWISGCCAWNMTCLCTIFCRLQSNGSAEAMPNRSEQGQLERVAEELCERFALYWRHEDLHDAGRAAHHSLAGGHHSLSCMSVADETHGGSVVFAQPCPWS